MPSPLDAFHELSCYTLAQPRDAFIHQLAVDAFAAQTCTAADPPIKASFALIGLHLVVERGFSGRQVQEVHIRLARGPRRSWPRFELPEPRGSMTVDEVLRHAPGPERDRAIRQWCAVVWEAWRDAHDAVRELAGRTTRP